MKRILALLLAAALVFGLAACNSGPKPEDTVKKFFDAMKAYDFETMQSCVDGEFDPEEMVSTEEDDPTGLFDYLKGNAANITYKTGTPEITDNTAKVPVSVEYTDASAVISQTFADYFTALFGMLFSDASEEEVNQLLTDALQKAIAENETGTATKELTLDMVLVGEEWKLKEMPEDEVADILTSNMLSSLNSLEDLFSSEDFDWGGEDPVEYAISDYVVFDNETAAMTIQRGGCDEWGNISFDVLCENKTDKKLTFSADSLVVNGWSVGGYLGTEVEAGESEVGTLDIWASDMKNIGLENPDQVVMNFRLYDEEGWWDDVYLMNETYTIYPTGLTEDQIVVPERRTGANEVTVADNDVFTFVILDGEKDETWGSFEIHAYVENKTDKPLYVAWEDVTVNGKDLDPYFSVTIPAGQRTVSEMMFGVNELEDNEIETVEDVAFTLKAMDDDAWEELYSEAHTYQP